MICRKCQTLLTPAWNNEDLSGVYLTHIIAPVLDLCDYCFRKDTVWNLDVEKLISQEKQKQYLHGKTLKEVCMENTKTGLTKLLTLL